MGLRHFGQPRGWSYGRVSERQVRAHRAYWMEMLGTSDPDDPRIPSRALRRRIAFRPKMTGGER